MALPGVRTVIKDRFYTLTRTDAPDGNRVAAIARRSNDPSSDQTLPADYSPFVPRNEEEVITAFGDGSELHRAYLELVAGGAARIDLIPVPSDTLDSDYESSATDSPLAKAFEAVESARSNIVALYGRGSHPTEWENPATPANDPNEIGIVADNDAGASTSLVKLVADHCAAISNRSRPVFAVMGVSPYVGVTAQHNSSEISPTDVSTHLDFANLADRESIGENGHYVTVVATELIPTGYDPAWGYANGAATYAGFLSGLASEMAATGKQLYNVQGLRYNPTRPKQEELIGKGLTPVSLNYRRQATVVDAQTFAKPESDYIRLSTLRIVFDAVQIIRNVCEGFVGMPATLEHRASLDTAISSKLRGMTVTGVLTNSDHNIQYFPRQNKAVVDLVLQPAFEIRNIEISIAVQL